MVPINKGSVVADLSSMSCNSTTSMTLCLDMQDFKECDSVYNWQSDTSFMEIFSFSGLKIILNQKNTTLNGGLISAYCVENNNCDDNTIRSLEINKQLIIMEGSKYTHKIIILLKNQHVLHYEFLKGDWNDNSRV